MGGINVNRCLIGGIVAGVIVFIVEGISSVFNMEEMTAAMSSAGLAMEMSSGAFLKAALVSLLVGMVLVFLYAASRPRFGPGPRTACIVALSVYLSGYLTSLIGYNMIGLFPNSLLVKWGAVGLIETLLAANIGAWLYQEG